MPDARVQAAIDHWAPRFVAQGAVGYTQFFTGLPALLVGTHMLGAGLLVVAAVSVILRLTEPVPPSSAPGGVPARAPLAGTRR